MTYSIVARDAVSGRFGVAIQTCWPFVGAGCPWVESGVGAVTTQSFSEVAHGPNGLALLRDGVAPAEALRRLLDPDPGREVRQVGLVDRHGRSASFTGGRCVEAAGHVTDDGVAIQANMMERPTVWPAMLAAWDAASGSFVDRLLASLRAAEKEGGDLRGRQSAVVLVSGTPDEPAWKRQWDVRVDDHPAPLDELERLVRLQLGFDALDRAEELATAGDLDGARAASEAALALTEGDRQVMAWEAIGLARAGQLTAGRAMLREASAGNPRWPEFVRRFAESGAQPELVDAARALLGGSADAED
ncbi:MAG TPA: DUF1028 domain-containing protein [Candidatus Limnocylindrales bacterium]|nr:DUF1028 domain-containing protein [Candidatus Limnocylindrales bacterium]